MPDREILSKKAEWVREETIQLHLLSKETRVASSLSDVEIFVALYYGRILEYRPSDPAWDKRDRFFVSKGHGGVSLYPILADLGFFEMEQLRKIGSENGILTVIPDASIPGIESTNGALGHGLGVACGVALGLKVRRRSEKVVVLCGDGELNEGAVWEAVMFAGFHRLQNLILIIDNNKMSMLGCQDRILGMEPLEEKFQAFGWKTVRVDGHDLNQLCDCLADLKSAEGGLPAVLIADTVKGKSVKKLEGNPLCHVISLNENDVAEIGREQNV
jgi:transketolase